MTEEIIKTEEVKTSTEETKPKHAGGRPLLFETVEDLETKVEEYFKYCEEKDKPLTISGLALAIGCDRRTIVNYSNKEEYFPTIKKARQMCERFAEEYLFSGKNIAGAIFNLKNNYDWKDRTETDLTTAGKPLPLLHGIYPDHNTQKDTGTQKEN
jgi:DNA-binding XRE family transcriptional regulator